jgi:SAM-dependent methyltransferase
MPEASPGARRAGRRLAEECRHYVPSQYFPAKTPGSLDGGARCENLEALTFADGSIDLHITQDVLEHVVHPFTAFRKVARMLKPGGAHVFTVPRVKKNGPSMV